MKKTFKNIGNKLKLTTLGFTLLELLAVIALISILTLLAVPITLSTVERAKRSTFKTSVLSMYTPVSLKFMKSDITNGDIQDLDMKNIKDFSGTWKIENGSTYLCNITNGIYIISSPNMTAEGCISEKDKNTIIIELVDGPTEPTEPTEPEEPEEPEPAGPNLDESGASEPNLHGNMIPIVYKDGKWVKADKFNAITDYQWYDYNTKKWANAVTVTESKRSTYLSAPLGTELLEADILTYMVWVPRYKYKLWNANNGTSSPKIIEIVFEDKNTTPSHGGNTTTNVERRYSTGVNGQYLTHPAFRFGVDELDGFWVGKFETSHNTLASSTTSNNLGCSNTSCTNASGIRVKPNLKTLEYNNISNMFYAARSMSFVTDNPFGYANDSEVDMHMLKNMEWGAIAYLSHSNYGQNTEITINNSYPIKTGCAGNTVNAEEAPTCQNAYQTTQGQKASTTGNIYGIYDIAGGATEFVMGNMVQTTSTPIGTLYSSQGGFITAPATKYFDSYANGPTWEYASDHGRGLLGDATKETLVQFGGYTSGGWYGDGSSIVNSTAAWFSRGGIYASGVAGGAFQFNHGNGIAYSDYSWRIAHK